MAAFDLNKFANSLKAGIIDLATKEGKEFADEARQDANDFVTAMRADLETWGGQLARGELSPGDFEILVKGRRDVAEMTALKQVGLAKVRIDRIVDGVIDLVITAAKAAA